MRHVLVRLGLTISDEKYDLNRKGLVTTDFKDWPQNISLYQLIIVIILSDKDDKKCSSLTVITPISELDKHLFHPLNKVDLLLNEEN